MRAHLAQLRRLTAAGLLAAAIAGCGGGGQHAAGSPPASSTPVPVNKDFVNIDLGDTMFRVTGMHVTGTYPVFHPPFSLSMDVLTDGQAFGTITRQGHAVTFLDAGRHLYARIAAFMLPGTVYAGQCPALCGKYVPVPSDSVQGKAFAAMDGAETLSFLREMQGDVKLDSTTVATTTFDGRPAIRIDLPGLVKGAYLIVSDTAPCIPLAAVVPGFISLVYTRWNDVHGKNVPLPARIAPYTPPAAGLAVPFWQFG